MCWIFSFGYLGILGFARDRHTDRLPLARNLHADRLPLVRDLNFDG